MVDRALRYKTLPIFHVCVISTHIIKRMRLVLGCCQMQATQTPTCRVQADYFIIFSILYRNLPRVPTFAWEQMDKVLWHVRDINSGSLAATQGFKANSALEAPPTVKAFLNLCSIHQLPHFEPFYGCFCLDGTRCSGQLVCCPAGIQPHK